MMNYLQILWPDGIFFTRTGGAQSKVDDDQPNLIPFQISQLGGSKVSNKGSFEEQLEAARRASDIKKMLFGEYGFLKILQ
jgi:sorting nexin-13